MNQIVESIIELEKEYGHDELMVGVTGEEGALDKIGLVCNLMDDADMGSLNRLIGSHSLSPECAAYLLFLAHPDDKDIFAAIDRLYATRSNEDRSSFRAVYYAQKFDEIKNFRGMIDLYEEIKEKYRMRYGACDTGSFTGKGAVYTVITGGYDDLCDPVVVNNEWDYYCFTDDPGRYRSEIWEISSLDNIIEGDPARTQRYAKTHPFILLPEYDYTVYIDGSLTIVGDLKEYINTFSRRCSMLCFPHPSRQKLEDEVEAIKSLRAGINLDQRTVFDEQIEQYRREGYKDSEPLVETGCLIRSNRDKLLVRVMEDWWEEIKTKTHRDQLSLGYVCWKNGYRYDISTLRVCNNRYLNYKGHK